jgi:DNA (cytosine-5)-methyltransferase 1
VDLFAGLGGFHRALRALGHKCVFASEIDDELRSLYEENFPYMKGKVFDDIRESKKKVPPHEILCAGFPCQPFSKSGFQKGTKDKTRGPLFHEVIEILKVHRPQVVLLENVGNFERHDAGRTWKIVKKSLAELGYDVRGTEHVLSGNGNGAGGHGLISPHHLGYPHSRERFFIAASREPLPAEPFPPADRGRETTLNEIVQRRAELSKQDKSETVLTKQQRRCIDHWNKLVQAIPKDTELPSFPIWGDEILAKYPYQDATPWALQTSRLRKLIPGRRFPPYTKKTMLLSALPSYARTPVSKFPSWKVAFIKSNREWFVKIKPHLTKAWIDDLLLFPPSLRKLEWNVKGGERDLWRHVLQFRPSGLRVRRYNRCPSLVAMTITQVPLLGPEGRFLTRVEGLRLQGFPDNHRLPESRTEAFAALGNAVHVGVAKAIAERLLVQRPAVLTG